MARYKEAADLLKAGQLVSDIPVTMGVTLASVKQYLYLAVGQGLIRRSDIAFAVREREIIEKLIAEQNTLYWFTIFMAAKRRGHLLDKDILKWYLTLRDARVSRGDMYEFMTDIEVALHRLIKQLLIVEFGSNGWWRQGIPAKIRSECAVTYENDFQPAGEPYSYTNFIHLKEILDAQWKLFSKYLPEYAINDKKQFLDSFNRLNRIRNVVMHPVKEIPLAEDDFEFVRSYYSATQSSRWRHLPPEMAQLPSSLAT